MQEQASQRTNDPRDGEATVYRPEADTEGISRRWSGQKQRLDEATSALAAAQDSFAAAKLNLELAVANKARAEERESEARSALARLMNGWPF